MGISLQKTVSCMVRISLRRDRLFLHGHFLAKKEIAWLEIIKRDR
jgi:hypothetical protein